MKRNAHGIAALLTALVLTGCGTPHDVAPRVQRLTHERVAWTFPGDDVASVVIRAGEAALAKVVEDREKRTVEVTAVPEGGAAGYHSPEPDWKETPASDSGLGFVGRQWGRRLVISSKSEIRFIHHSYFLKAIEVRVPVGVKVLLEAREVSGDGAPDLRR